MSLYLANPALHNRTCAECVLWMYDEKTGQKMIRAGQPLPRGKSPTPCWQCPKGSPTEAHNHELSLKNRLAYGYFVQARAPLGERLPADAITHRVLGHVDRLVRAAEAGRASSSLVESLLVASMSSKGKGR